MSGDCEKLISVREAAELLGVCVRLVWRMLSEGKFTRVKHPEIKRTCLLLSEVQAYIHRIAELEHAAV